MKRLWMAIAAVLVLSFCGPRERTDTARPTPAETKSLSVDESWLAELLEHREEKDEEFRTSMTSPMAGTQYLPSEPRETVHLTREDRTFGLAYQPVPEAVLSVVKQPTGWHWQDQGSNVVCQEGDDELPSGAPLEARARCDVDEFSISVYAREHHVTFIVFDPERPEKRSFEHLLYFAPDEDYAVEARFTRTPENGEVKMLTSQNLEKTYYRYAKLEFQVEGEKQELTAFKAALSGEGSSTLFIPFKDATNTRETYGAGRFLEIPEPEEAQFILDFNRCFNPLCNYSPAYNCPIPPRENRLAVAIRAGEKKYPHSTGP